MQDISDELKRKLEIIRLVVTDVDGVHTNDTVAIGIPSDPEKVAFGITEAGAFKRYLVCDEDGTPTGEVDYLALGQDGRTELYRFYTGDGIAIKECLRSDPPIAVAMMSGRKAPPVRQRAIDLGARCLQGIKDKVAAVEELIDELGLTWENVLFVGNDIQDIAMLKRAGVSAVPADAAVEAKPHADHVGQKGGGAGIVREVIELLLEAQGGKWTAIVERERTLG